MKGWSTANRRVYLLSQLEEGFPKQAREQASSYLFKFSPRYSSPEIYKHSSYPGISTNITYKIPFPSSLLIHNSPAQEALCSVLSDKNSQIIIIIHPRHFFHTYTQGLQPQTTPSTTPVSQSHHPKTPDPPFLCYMDIFA